MGKDGDTMPGFGVGQERDAARVEVVPEKLHRLAAT